MFVDERDELGEAVGVRVARSARVVLARVGCDDRRGVGVLVWVDTDDDVDGVCQDGHDVSIRARGIQLPTGSPWSGWAMIVW